MNIIFFANGNFAINSLNALIKSKHNILAVVTNKDKKVGRGQKLKESLISRLSTEKSIEVLKVDEFDNQDKFLLTLTQNIESKTTPDVMNLPDVIDITFYKTENKTICRVNVNPTPENIYVKHRNDNIFYKRKGPKTVPLRDRDLVKYIEQKNTMYE